MARFVKERNITSSRIIQAAVENFFHIKES